MRELFERIAAGDGDCLRFLLAVEDHFAKAGRFIGEGSRGAREFIGLLAQTNLLFSLPYYTRNAQALYLVSAGSLLELGASIQPVPPVSIIVSVAMLKHGPVAGWAFREELMAAVRQAAIDGTGINE